MNLKVTIEIRQLLPPFTNNPFVFASIACMLATFYMSSPHFALCTKNILNFWRHIGKQAYILLMMIYKTNICSNSNIQFFEGLYQFRKRMRIFRLSYFYCLAYWYPTVILVPINDDVYKHSIHCLTISVSQSIIRFSIYFRLVNNPAMPPASFKMIQHRKFQLMILYSDFIYWTRLGLQCQTLLMSYPLSLIPCPLSLVPWKFDKK